MGNASLSPIYLGNQALKDATNRDRYWFLHSFTFALKEIGYHPLNAVVGASSESCTAVHGSFAELIASIVQFVNAQVAADSQRFEAAIQDPNNPLVATQAAAPPSDDLPPEGPVLARFSSMPAAPPLRRQLTPSRSLTQNVWDSILRSGDGSGE